MGNEVKVRSLRIDEETYNKFRELTNLEFGNQGMCLASLIDIYNYEKSKEKIITRKKEIETFQFHINKLNELYVTSLHISENAELLAKEEIKNELEQKNKQLEDFHKKLIKKEEEGKLIISQKNELESKQKELYNSNNELQKNIDLLNKDYTKKLLDKDNLIQSLLENADNYKNQINESEKKLANMNSITTHNNELTSEIDSLKSNINELSQELIKLKEAFYEQEKEFEFKLEKEKFELEKSTQNKLSKLKEEHFNKINSINEEHASNILNLQKNYNNSINELNSKYTSLEDNKKKSQKDS